MHQIMLRTSPVHKILRAYNARSKVTFNYTGDARRSIF
jgi:hypothetical protein